MTTPSRRQTVKVTDKVRLDWLTRMKVDVFYHYKGWGVTGVPLNPKRSPRACIDAAIRSERTQGRKGC